MKISNMKTKLIQTEEHLLLIDVEAEIKEGNYYLTYLGNIYQETKRPFEEDEGIERFTNRNTYKCILSYYPLTKEAKELDLPWLPNPFEKKCTEQIVAEFCRNSENVNYNNIKDKVHLTFLQEDMILLYNQAQSKQFSLEDMKKAIRMAQKGYDEFGGSGFLRHVREHTETEIIQSLSTQQLPVSFEPEYKYLDCLECEGLGWMLSCSKCKGEGSEKTSELKTITNSEGKKEILGTYKY